MRHGGAGNIQRGRQALDPISIEHIDLMEDWISEEPSLLEKDDFDKDWESIDYSFEKFADISIQDDVEVVFNEEDDIQIPKHESQWEQRPSSGNDERLHLALEFGALEVDQNYKGRQFNSFGADNSVIFNKEDQGRGVKNLCLRCPFLKVFVSVAAEHKSLKNALNQGGPVQPGLGPQLACNVMLSTGRMFADEVIKTGV
ncbi:hypothetical protein Cgig2_009332 [Carnegiea gigantea]|uniref:Uncharacterized protein n=1 Tax=Carnegiea gigantea TaxID=171969 RepID=A0A9Q1JG46_9CARY|nr:hypothetical protein Cgig2_009332 [Carnegiea gigantea]